MRKRNNSCWKNNAGTGGVAHCVTLWCRHPYGHWFAPQLFHFQSISLLMAWEKAMEDGPSAWVPVAHRGNLDEVPGFQLWFGPSPGHCSHLEIDQWIEELSLFLPLCNSFKQTNKQHFFKKRRNVKDKYFRNHRNRKLLFCNYDNWVRQVHLPVLKLVSEGPASWCSELSHCPRSWHPGVPISSPTCSTSDPAPC